MDFVSQGGLLFTLGIIEGNKFFLLVSSVEYYEVPELMCGN